jgi:hypothetical protein
VLFKELVKHNRKVFPDYADEISGIAHGAEVEEDEIWMLNLLGELDGAYRYGMPSGMTVASPPCSPRTRTPTPSTSACSSFFDDGHCSTFIFKDESGDLLLAHNEDWDADVADLIYLLDATYPGDEHLVGFGYPGQLLGFAIVANRHGIVFTQNSVFPQKLEVGLGVTFVGRLAMKAARLEDAIEVLTTPGQAWGISVNLLAPAAKVGANIEVGANGRSHVRYVAEPMAYAPHFNQYSHLVGATGWAGPGSSARTAHEETMKPPDSLKDVTHRLCNRDGDGAVYCRTTFLSLIVEATASGATASLWHKVPPCGSQPAHVWHLGAGIIN